MTECEETFGYSVHETCKTGARSYQYILKKLLEVKDKNLKAIACILMVCLV